MLINPDFLYSLKEVNEKIGIHPRKLNRVAKKHNIQKVDNRYLFSGGFLLNVFPIEIAEKSKSVKEKSKSVKTTNQPQSKKTTPEERYKEKLRKAIELINLEAIKQNKTHRIFTEEEYSDAEQKLNEWYDLQKEITRQEELFNVKLKSVQDIAEHYQTQFEYQRKQSEKILAIHQTLIDTIEKQNQIALQRNFIEAKDKGLDKK